MGAMKIPAVAANHPQDLARDDTPASTVVEVVVGGAEEVVVAHQATVDISISKSKATIIAITLTHLMAVNNHLSVRALDTIVIIMVAKVRFII
jgi:hypothetical protein